MYILHSQDSHGHLSDMLLPKIGYMLQWIHSMNTLRLQDNRVHRRVLVVHLSDMLLPKIGYMLQWIHSMNTLRLQDNRVHRRVLVVVVDDREGFQQMQGISLTGRWRQRQSKYR
jgi:hypothetical protein